MSSSSNCVQTSYPRFRNEKCGCRLRAAIRISESDKNPGRLYYGCPKEKDKGKCDFWEWCNPIGYNQPNPDVASAVEPVIKSDARVEVIEVNVANLKHMVNIIWFFCGIALAMSFIALLVALVK